MLFQNNRPSLIMNKFAVFYMSDNNLNSQNSSTTLEVMTVGYLLIVKPLAQP